MLCLEFIHNHKPVTMEHPPNIETGHKSLNFVIIAGMCMYTITADWILGAASTVSTLHYLSQTIIDGYTGWDIVAFLSKGVSILFTVIGGIFLARAKHAEKKVHDLTREKLEEELKALRHERDNKV